jgi:hypothetical protein
VLFVEETVVNVTPSDLALDKWLLREPKNHMSSDNAKLSFDEGTTLHCV